MTDLVLISSTAIVWGSQIAMLHIDVRRIDSSSFSASSTVAHSSSTRRKQNAKGVPEGSNRDEPSLASFTSNWATHSPASFMPEIQPKKPENVIEASAC